MKLLSGAGSSVARGGQWEKKPRNLSRRLRKVNLWTTKLYATEICTFSPNYWLGPFCSPTEKTNFLIINWFNGGDSWIIIGDLRAGGNSDMTWMGEVKGMSRRPTHMASGRHWWEERRRGWRTSKSWIWKMQMSSPNFFCEKKCKSNFSPR